MRAVARLGLIAAAALLAPAGWAQEPACPAVDPPAVAAPGAGASGRAAFHVFVDPATGRPRPPTADELRRLAEERLAARENAPPRVFTVITHSNGMKSVDLGDAFLFDLRVVRQPDGTAHLECLPHAQAGATAPAR